MPDPQPDSDTVGVYLHVPFCRRVCPYCDFAVVAARCLEASEEERYLTALLAELERRAPIFAGRRLVSLYFGGGTPSLLQAESLARLREAVGALFPPAPGGVEITLEVNPSTLERERLPAFRSEAGVNRLSLGVQSFDDSLLKALGRAHRAEESHRTWAAARRAGFENLSLDLIFAALHQTPAMLAQDLDEISALAPEHVSTYELTLEPQTPFGRAAERGRIRRYPADRAADLLDTIQSRLTADGFEQYELTNFARPGFESVHNSRYWTRSPVLALGTGAHSSDPPSEARPYGARPANPRLLAAYLARVEAGEPVAEAVDVPDAAQARAEAVFLALRRRVGLSAEAFAAEFGAAPRHYFASAIELLASRGLLIESPEGDMRLTQRGRLLADTVFEYFA